MKVFIPGGAGLVGLNLIALLQKDHPDWELLVVDKKKEAVSIGQRIFPSVTFISEDLTETVDASWPQAIKACDACVMLQAEISNTDPSQFERNNVLSTEVVLDLLQRHKVTRLVHVSSSVVNSISNDLYTKTKRLQESIVLARRPDAVVLRPTLMFGWFDRKHLGWIARFMKKSPVLPIPGSGKFFRQPLYAGDFCMLIQRCLEDNAISGTHNITGLEKISYLSLMRQLRLATGSQSLMISLPIPLFGFLLQLWALISRKPAFTRSQLKALTAGDEFETTNWPQAFSVTPTPLSEALQITYQHPQYGTMEMPF